MQVKKECIGLVFISDSYGRWENIVEMVNNIFRHFAPKRINVELTGERKHNINIDTSQKVAQELLDVAVRSDNFLLSFIGLGIQADNKIDNIQIYITKDWWNDPGYFRIFFTAYGQIDKAEIASMSSFIFREVSRKYTSSCGFGSIFIDAPNVLSYSNALVRYERDESFSKELEEEFYWYKKLARPLELMHKHGYIRNIYNINLLNGKQYEQFMASIRIYSINISAPDVEKISDDAYIIIVDEANRPDYFSLVKKNRATLYRFFCTSSGSM